MDYFSKPLLFLIAGTLSVLVAGSRSALAAVVEKERLGSFSNAQYLLLPGLVVGNILLSLQDPPSQAKWSGGVLTDDSVRDAMRLTSHPARTTAATVSDILLYSLVAYPYVVDAGLDAGLVQRDGRTAGRLALVQTQAYALTGAMVQTMKLVTARQRPFQPQCAADPDYDAGCGEADSRMSFFSGHAAFAFTAAGLICASHKGLELAGGMTPCYVSLGAAVVVGVARIFADRHYLSDVLVGAVVGTLSGYVVTRATQYQAAPSPSAPAARGLALHFTFGL